MIVSEINVGHLKAQILTLLWGVECSKEARGE